MLHIAVEPERWNRIERFYHAALEREPGGRAAFLAEVCPEPDLRREVESLLGFDGSDDSLLEHPAWAKGFRTGERAGPYEILDRIGKGGMGEVWSARDTRLDRTVAIKIASGRFSERFEREAKTIASLNHPNICTLYDVGPNYLVMELITGRTLDQIIPKKGMRLGEVLRLGVDIADALTTAHTQGIVHRDLKPSNVMVTDKGRVKVLDFGLARLAAQGSFANGAPGAHGSSTTFAGPGPQTGEGSIVGTVAYMSPEQAQGLPVDARSDIFSFGILLYEMVTGAQPFRGDTKVATLAAVIKEEPKRARELVDELPAELERIIARCLRKDPARRFQNMSDLHVALSELKEESESGTLNPPAVTARAGRGTRKWLWAAGSLVGLVAAAAGVWALRVRTGNAGPQRLVPVTSYAGNQMLPALSPDGSQVAFSWGGERNDNVDIYVKQIGQPDSLRLTSDPAPDLFPTWSPDGKRIAFRRDDGIYTVSSLGGSERRIGGGFAITPIGSRFGYGLSWSPDGKGLAVRSEASSSIVFLPLDEGGDPRPLTKPVAQERDVAPSFSRDGRQLAFFRCGSGPVSCALQIQPLDAEFRARGAARLVSAKRFALYGLPAWSADGKSLVFGGSPHQGLDRLWRVPADGSNPPQRVEVAGWAATSPSVSGDRLIFSRTKSQTDIWRYQEGGVPEPLFHSTLWEFYAQFSPNGGRIALQADLATSGDQIWTAKADGTGLTQLTPHDVAYAGGPRWSPDGKWIVFYKQRDGGYYDIAVMESSGGRMRQLTSNYNNQYPSFSHDGKSIWYRSNRTGRNEVWRIPFEGGHEEQFTKDGGGVPCESPDGRTLYYNKGFLLDARTPLFAQDTGGGPERQVLPEVFGSNFAPVEDGIWFIGPVSGGREQALQFFRFADGKTRVAVAVPSPHSSSTLSVSPDRKTVLYSTVETPGAVLEMIEGFR